MNPAEFANIAATESRFWWFQGMERMLWDFLDAERETFAQGRVLEVGCGTGRISEEFTGRYPQARLASLDYAAEGLQYCRSRGLERLTQGDIRHLPYRDGSASLLLSLDVIAHLQPGEEALAFAEFARVLQPGGLLVLRCSAFGWLRSRHSQYVNEIQRHTFPQLRPHLRANGLRVLRRSYANSFLLPVALAKFRLWEPLFQQQAESGLQAVNPLLNTLLRQPLMLEAAVLRAGGRFPVGQSLWVVARKEAAPAQRGGEAR